MVMLHPLHGINPWGDGSDGVGPTAGSGKLTAATYNFTSWTITGWLYVVNNTGCTVHVQGDMTINGTSRGIVNDPNATSVSNWAAATNGSDIGVGGDAMGITVDRSEITYTHDFFKAFSLAGAGGDVAWAATFGDYSKPAGRLTIFCGGVVDLSSSSYSINYCGISGHDTDAAAHHGSGGGGGGIVQIFSGTEIILGHAGYTIYARGGNGGDGSAAGAGWRAGGGGGGGVVVLMAPKITLNDGAGNYVDVQGGTKGATDNGAGAGSGGGGSYGAGGNVNTDGSNGIYYSFQKFNPMNAIA